MRLRCFGLDYYAQASRAAHDRDRSFLRFPLPTSGLVEDEEIGILHDDCIVASLLELNWLQHVPASVHFSADVDFDIHCSEDIVQQLLSQILPSKLSYERVPSVCGVAMSDDPFLEDQCFSNDEVPEGGVLESNLLMMLHELEQPVLDDDNCEVQQNSSCSRNELANWTVMAVEQQCDDDDDDDDDFLRCDIATDVIKEQQCGLAPGRIDCASSIESGTSRSVREQEYLKLLDDDASEEDLKIMHEPLFNLPSFALPELDDDDDEHHASLSVNVSRRFKDRCLRFKAESHDDDATAAAAAAAAAAAPPFPQHLDPAQFMQDMFAPKLKLDRSSQEPVSAQPGDRNILFQDRSLLLNLEPCHQQDDHPRFELPEVLPGGIESSDPSSFIAGFTDHALDVKLPDLSAVVSRESFESLIVMPTLSLDHILFCTLPVPLFSEEEANLAVSVLESLSRRARMFSVISASDMIYLDWHLSQGSSNCNNYSCFCLQKKLREEGSCLVPCCAPEEKSLKIIDLLVAEFHPCDGLNEGSKSIIIPKESCNQLRGHHVQESRYKEDFPWASLLEGSQSQRQRNRGPGSPQQEAKRPKGNLRRDKKSNRHVPVNDNIHAQGNTLPLVHAAEDEVEMLTRLALQYDDEIMNAVATQFVVVGPDQNHCSSDMTKAMDPQSMVAGGRQHPPPTIVRRRPVRIVAKLISQDGEDVISLKRSLYQKIIRLESEDFLVVERKFRLPVDLILSPSICFILYTVQKLKLWLSDMNVNLGQSPLSLMIDIVVCNHMKVTSLAFGLCIMAFEGNHEFASAVNKISPKLHAAADCLSMRVQFIVTTLPNSSDDHILELIAEIRGTANEKVNHVPIPECITSGEASLMEFPSLNPLSAHAISNLRIPLHEFVSLSYEDQRTALEDCDIPKHSLLLFAEQWQQQERAALAQSIQWPSASEVGRPAPSNPPLKDLQQEEEDHAYELPYFPPASEITGELEAKSPEYEPKGDDYSRLLCSPFPNSFELGGFEPITFEFDKFDFLETRHFTKLAPAKDPTHGTVDLVQTACNVAGNSAWDSFRYHPMQRPASKVKPSFRQTKLDQAGFTRDQRSSKRIKINAAYTT